MWTHPDVLVIGGGVIGLTTAYYLARDGAMVTILDRSAPGTEASWAGAGIIPPGNPERASTPYDRLRALSSHAYPLLSAELLEQIGIDNGYRRCGGIEVFDGQRHDVLQMWRNEGIDFQSVDERDLRELEVNVHRPITPAYHLPAMAQVRNPWHLRALVAACQQHNVQIHADRPIERFRTTGERIVAAVDESGTEFVADRFLIAAGAWADRLLSQLGLRTGIHPVLGQMVLFHPSAPLLRRIICFEKRYLVPREDGRILVGSTEEPEAGYEKRTTPDGIRDLVQFARGVLPTLDECPPEGAWAGLRPGSPDGLPTLGRVPAWVNAYVAAGHYRAGIQLSPATGRAMADLILERNATIALEAFRPDRPIAPHAAMAFRS